MLYLLLGLIFGAGALWLYQQSQTTKVVAWYAWVLFVIGAASIAFGFEILSGSMIEHEFQAGWMGLGFCIVIAVVTFVAGWRFGVADRVSPEKE